MVAAVSIPAPASLPIAAAHAMPRTSKPDLHPLRWLAHAATREAGRDCFGQSFELGLQIRVGNERGAQRRPHISSADRDRFVDLYFERNSDLCLRFVRTARQY